MSKYVGFYSVRCMHDFMNYLPAFDYIIIHFAHMQNSVCCFLMQTSMVRQFRIHLRNLMIW